LVALDASVKVGVQQLVAKLEREEEQLAVDVRDAEIREQHANP